MSPVSGEEEASEEQALAKDQTRVRDMSHLIVWEIESTNPFYTKK